MSYNLDQLHVTHISTAEQESGVTFPVANSVMGQFGLYLPGDWREQVIAGALELSGYISPALRFATVGLSGAIDQQPAENIEALGRENVQEMLSPDFVRGLYLSLLVPEELPGWEAQDLGAEVMLTALLWEYTGDQADIADLTHDFIQSDAIAKFPTVSKVLLRKAFESQSGVQTGFVSPTIVDEI